MSYIVVKYNQILVHAISRQEASLQQNWVNRTAEEIRTLPYLDNSKVFL